MHPTVDILRDLFIIFLLAKSAGEVMIRLHQPPVIGELLVGMLIGAHAFGLVDVPCDGAGCPPTAEIVEVIAELGVVFLLFEVGLENRFSDLRRVGGTAGMVAASGVIVPFVAGFALLRSLGHPNAESLFMGAAMVATSVGVTARVLGDMGLLRERPSQVILGAAVIDDVLGLLVLAVVAGTTGGDFSVWDIGVLVVEAAVFLVLAATVGTRVVRRVGPTLQRLRLSEGPFTVGIVACLGFAALAGMIGLAAIVGAFLAGMVFAEMRDHYPLERRIEPVTHFLTPFFFVFTGMQVEPGFFTDPPVLILGLAVFGLAIVTKLVPCSLAAWRLGRRNALVVGVGMAPRAEVGIIVASIGLASGTIGPEVYGVVVSMSILTTLASPPFLRVLLRDVLEARRRESETAEAQGGEPFGHAES